MITPRSDGPYAPYGEAMTRFGRLAGSWETAITYYAADGSRARAAIGEWEFGHALAGRAVIDVWQVPARRLLADGRRAPEQECGLCVRIWDPRLALWRLTFHSTASSATIRMYARQLGDELVLERADGAALERRVFSAMGETTFAWRSERSEDGGRRWRLQQTVQATRVPSHAVASG